MSEQTVQLPKEGDKVGSGILLSFISSGGSAYIYKTWNESLEIHRAVKVMSPDAPPDVRDRFQTEGRINSKLLHPNIVQCFNFGTTSGGLPYLEMEYLSGASLADLIHKRSPLPLPVVLAISIGILEALSYAHTIKYTLYDKQYVGLVHRDLKPANIILTADGNVKLMDFGIARPVDVSLHTLAGTVPGTVAYMSPEACAGGDVDFRSDLYQFGLCLYEFISGQAAFPQSDLTSLLKAKTSNKYQPIETHTKNINSRILPILHRCLQLDPKERFQSAQTCLTEIRSFFNTLYPSTTPAQLLLSFLDGQPVRSNPDTMRFRKIIKPILYTSVGFVFLLLVTLFALRYGNFLIQKLKQISPIYIQQKTSSPKVPEPSIPSSTTTQNSATAPIKPQPPKPTSSSSVVHKKPRDSHANDTVKSPTISQDDALFFINQGKQQYSANLFNEALANFQSAIKMPSQQPRQQIVRTCVYWSAKCNSVLYKQNSIPLSNYQAAWRSVLNSFPANTPEHIEASEHLQEVQN
jgi:serine/threonine protein kinase